ncbi:MAG: prenyltransferase [Flavobacterium psychrophilum]|nr:MAG: prenyltransferase [Flavobacterium psychrophilum]
MKFLKLIGFGHLILLAFAQFIFKYGFLDYQPGISLTLNDTGYMILVLTSVMIAAGGFLITNIIANGSESYGLSESAAYYIYGGFTIGGLALGYYLSDLIGRPSFMMAFAIAVGTLYFYATNLRESLLLGNIVIAFLMGLSIMVIGIFALYPVVGTTSELDQLMIIFKIIIHYSVFATVLGLLITLVNDLKNTDIDYNEGLNTLPIAIGKQRAVKIALGIGVVVAGLVVYYINAQLKDFLWAMAYLLVFVLGPVIYCIINLWSAKTAKDFRTLEVVLNAVLFFTALSIAVITFNIQINA